MIADPATLLKYYNRLVERNAHTLAVMLLVENFGTEDEMIELGAIDDRHRKQGYISPEDDRRRSEISNKYYHIIKK